MGRERGDQSESARRSALACPMGRKTEWAAGGGGVICGRDRTVKRPKRHSSAEVGPEMAAHVALWRRSRYVCHHKAPKSPPPLTSLPLLWYSWPKARRGEGGRMTCLSLYATSSLPTRSGRRRRRGILHLRNKLHGIDRHSAFGGQIQKER